MAPVTFDIPDTVTCFHCRKDTPTKEPMCSFCGEENFRLDIGQFMRMIDKRQLVDIRAGGLVLGRPGPEDDIPMFDYAGTNVLQIIGKMQGMEFILGTEASLKHRNTVAKLNGDKGDPADLPDPNWSLATNVFDTNTYRPLDDLEWPHAGVWVGQQFIVNRYATKLHFERLVELNRDY